MSRRLDIFIHRPVSNARASHRVARDHSTSNVSDAVRRILDGKVFAKDAWASPADIEKLKKELADLEAQGKGKSDQAKKPRFYLGKTGKELLGEDEKSFANTIRDSLGALIGGNHRPEGVHAKETPIATDANKPDKNANSKAGKQKDIHGTVTITWKEDGWYYSGGGASDGPFNTSEEAFKAASSYGD